MRRRADPRQVAKLVEVQHARRATAGAALALARDGEMHAHAQATAALKDASAAQNDWFAFLNRPGFAPDYARALAARLVARESAADEAGKEYRIATDIHHDRQDDWRLSEAHVRLVEASLDRARRDAGRNREERQLGELSDRITYAWVRP